jgi:oligoribonuclease NrnB/cAMP/cGMP phosphodiesterase (DHH superfamily)
MNNELVVMTHNDLDALGSMLNLEYALPGVPKKFYHTNYSNINEIVDEIEEYIKRNGNTHIICPDVSFSDNKGALERLYNLANVVHIDHHMYPDGFWDVFPDMKVSWDKTKSATLLTNEYFKNTGKNANLDKLTYLIDVYDLWQKDSPHFGVSQDLNEYFWACGIEWLFNEIVKNDYTLPSNFTNVVQNIRKECATAIASFEERKLIQRAGEITFCFVDSWFNQIMLKEMAEGKNFVIGITSYGIVKIRIREEAPYTEAQKQELRLELTGNDNIGHLNAFTYKIFKQDVKFDDIMEEVQKITKLLERIMG